MLNAAESKLACDTCCESLVFTNNIKIKHIELRTFQPNIDLSSCRACSLEVCRCSMLPLSTWRLSDTWKRSGSDHTATTDISPLLGFVSRNLYVEHTNMNSDVSAPPLLPPPSIDPHINRVPLHFHKVIVCCRDRLQADQLLAILMNNKGIDPEYKPKEYLRTSHYRF